MGTFSCRRWFAGKGSVISLHELGVVLEVVKAVEEIAREQQLTAIDTVVLQIGELSSMIPMYVEQCYPAAVSGTLLENTILEIEVMPGNGMCRNCNKVFNLLANKQKCPQCGGDQWELLSGKEFYIKEIIAC